MQAAVHMLLGCIVQGSIPSMGLSSVEAASVEPLSRKLDVPEVTLGLS